MTVSLSESLAFSCPITSTNETAVLPSTMADSMAFSKFTPPDGRSASAAFFDLHSRGAPRRLFGLPATLLFEELFVGEDGADDLRKNGDRNDNVKSAIRIANKEMILTNQP